MYKNVKSVTLAPPRIWYKTNVLTIMTFFVLSRNRKIQIWTTPSHHTTNWVTNFGIAILYKCNVTTIHSVFEKNNYNNQKVLPTILIPFLIVCNLKIVKHFVLTNKKKNVTEDGSVSRLTFYIYTRACVLCIVRDLISSNSYVPCIS